MAANSGVSGHTTRARIIAAALVPLGIVVFLAVPGLASAAQQPAWLLVLVAFSGLLGGLWFGLAAAALQCAYAVWLLTAAGGADAQSIITSLLAAPVVAIAAGILRHGAGGAGRVAEAQEAFANQIFEQAGVAIAYADVGGRILRCNQMYSDLVGRSREEVVGMNFKDLVDPRDREENWALSRQLLAGETDKFTLENRYIRKDGTSVWSRKIVSLIRNATGTPSHLLLFATDITDEMALRAELKQSEADYRTLWESAGNANFLVFAPAFRIEQANAAALRFFGAGAQKELAALTLADLSPERQDDGEASAAKVDRLLADALRDGTAAFEWLFRARDGKEAYATVSITRIEETGRTGLQCSAVDISDRVLLTRHQSDARRLLAEEVNARTAELEDVTYELHLAQSVGGMGSFSIDLVSRTFSCSPETARILNLDEFDRIDTAKWIEKVHPGDSKAVLLAWEKALAGAPFNVTYRVVVPGGIRHVKAGARIKRDSEGNAISAVGALLDLTSLLASREENIVKGYRGRVDGLLAATAAVQADAEQNIETDPQSLARMLLQQFPDWNAEEIDAVVDQSITTIKRQPTR